jgi:ParB/RepB/Spo0J family partition protein
MTFEASATPSDSTRALSSCGSVTARPESRRDREIVLISPFRCRVWTYNHRSEEKLTEEACRGLIEDIKTSGQQVPALGRRLHNEPDHEVEIIYGSRRHLATRLLGRDLIVEIREITDDEALCAMEKENQQRMAPSPYERGRTWLRLLRGTTCKSHQDIADRIGVARSLVSRLISIAELPAVIVAAFASPDDIRADWGFELHRAWNDETRRPWVIRRARAFERATARPPPRQIYSTLISPAGTPASVPRPGRHVPVTDELGKVVFHRQYRPGKTLWILSAALLDSRTIESIDRTILDLVQMKSQSGPGCAASRASEGSGDAGRLI